METAARRTEAAHLDVEVPHVVLHGLQASIAAERGSDHEDGCSGHAGRVEC